MRISFSKLKLSVNAALPVPLYQQLVDSLTEHIASGQFEKDAQLPSIREIAVGLRINPQAVVRAFDALEADSLIRIEQGRGAFVNASARELLKSRNVLFKQALEAFLQKAATLGVSREELETQFRQKLQHYKGPQT